MASIQNILKIIYVAHYDIFFPLDDLAAAEVREEFQIWNVFLPLASKMGFTYGFKRAPTQK